jgi:hypothetical protein
VHLKTFAFGEAAGSYTPSPITLLTSPVTSLPLWRSIGGGSLPHCPLIRPMLDALARGEIDTPHQSDPSRRAAPTILLPMARSNVARHTRVGS